MEAKITNKIVKIENILEIAEILEKRTEHYRSLQAEEEQKFNEAKMRDEFYSKKFVDFGISYSITFKNNETIRKTNEFDWFQSMLTARADVISEINIYFQATSDEEHENVSIDLTKNRIYLSSNAKDMQSNDMAHTVENYFKSLQVRYDAVIAKKSVRKFMPSLSISLIIGLIASIAFFTVCKLNILTFENAILSKLLSVGILALVSILGSLGIPTQNHNLYRNIKMEKYYAGMDSGFKSIYKDDIASYKNENEVCIGENAIMPEVRQKIEKNFKRAKKMILFEVLLAVVAIVLFILI